MPLFGYERDREMDQPLRFTGITTRRCPRQGAECRSRYGERFIGSGLVTGAFAEFERTMIRQRIKAGLKRAVAQGVKLGRPKIDNATARKVRRQLAKGVGMLRVAKSLGIGTGTVQRIARELG